MLIELPSNVSRPFLCIVARLYSLGFEKPGPFESPPTDILDTGLVYIKFVANRALFLDTLGSGRLGFF